VHPVRDAACLWELVSLLRKMCPDVVHTHSSKAGVLGRLAAAIVGVPVTVHTIHGMSFNRTQPAVVRWLFRQVECACAEWTDSLVCVAETLKDQAVAAGLAPPDRCRTVYSGMEVDEFDEARYARAAIRARWGAGDQAIVVGTIARLFPQKGYEQLLAVMPAWVAAEPRLRFVWVGDGAARREYVRRLEEAGLRERVYLTGLVEPAAIPAQLAGMDLLVHCSQWEGLPRVLVQALLMRVPVVSFDNDGAPEVNLPGRTGELVPLNDLERLTRAVLALAGDAARRRRYGEAGRALCLERFDHHLMVERLDELYRALLDNRGYGR
jgi:glycosyltransferase involved in cell wall biosynthesis